MNISARATLEHQTAIAYDAFAPIGIDHEIPVFVDSAMLSIRNRMIHQPRLLDLGCGLGRLIPIFHELDILQVVGVDYSRESIRIAQQRYPQHDFRIGNILDLKAVLGDEKFDAFFAITTLMHILPENMRLAVANIRDALNMGAIGFIATPFGDEEDTLNAGVLDLSLEGHSIFRKFWTLDDLAQYFKEGGFNVIPPSHCMERHMVYLTVEAI